MKLPKLTIKNEKVKKVLKALNKKWIKVCAVLIIIVLVISSFLSNLSKNMRAAMSQMNVGSAIKVERRDINTNISSSGIVEPLDTYKVTTLVEGEVITADFEEGDQVEKDQILYHVDTEKLNSKIESAQTAIERGERRYNLAVKDYNTALELYDDLQVKANASGQITEFKLEAGDNITAGAAIGKITDNATMLLKIPFNSTQVSNDWVGQTAAVLMEDTLETIFGTVTEVNQLEQVLTGGRLVKMVTIELHNPGGITADLTATASIGQVTSSDVGTFEPANEKTLIAKGSGEITDVNVKVGDFVTKNQVLISLSKKNVDTQVQGYKTAMDNAKDTVEDAKKNLEDLQDSLKDYEIKAPISGQIISKQIKAGDKLSLTNMTTLAVIYDMSAFRFKMSIDELDIKKITLDQKVIVTADALPNVTMEGFIETVSLESVNANGITQYPVTVRMNDIGELLPGISVNGEIVVGSVENVLSIPIDALMRGNVVYLKDDTVTAVVGEVPAGYREVKVEIGTMNDNYVEIKSGLAEGDEVYVRPRMSSNIFDSFGGGGGGVRVQQ